jgi:hypothetical protein
MFRRAVILVELVGGNGLLQIPLEVDRQVLDDRVPRLSVI